METNTNSHRELTAAPPCIGHAIDMVHGEYRDLPGLNLTRSQMRRFIGLDVLTCNAVLDILERERFLEHTADDVYVLARSPAAKLPPGVRD
jgi:hypothetical protein